MAQDITIHSIISDIENAQLPGSVTNGMVARALKLLYEEKSKPSPDKDLVTDVTFTASPEDVELGVDVYNPSKGSTGEKCTLLPMASPEQAGFMSAAQAKKLQDLNNGSGGTGSGGGDLPASLNGFFATEVTFAAQTEDVELGVDVLNPVTGETDEHVSPMPMASPVQAGFMTASQAKKLQETSLTSFVDFMKVAVSSDVYDSKTGCFKINGINNITEADARRISYFSDLLFSDGGYAAAWPLKDVVLRTNVLRPRRLVGAVVHGLGATVEVLRVAPDETLANCATGLSGYLPKCKSIIGVIQITPSSSLSFAEATDLYDVNLKLVANSSAYELDLSACSKLSFASLERMVTNALKGSAVKTVRLHADAFARLTEDLLAAAAIKNMSFVEVEIPE